MTTGLPQAAGACCLLAIVLATTSITSGQVADPLVKARALYAEASYDEALAILKGSDGAEAYQYRALCFIALGRTQEAERALESLISLAPTHAVSDADLSPRFVALFAQTRRRVMPGVVKRLFAEARTEFQARNMASARDKFEKVLTLTHDPAIADSPDAVDLQLLVASYIDIVKNSPPAPLMASMPARTPVTGAPVVSPRLPIPTVAPIVVAPVVSAAPAASPVAVAVAPLLPAPAPAAVSAVPRTLVPAVTVRQSIPAFIWRPGEPPRPISGAIRITIGADGKVKTASMDVSVEPRYDARLISVARSWVYQPATLDGQPIESERTVQINISP